MWVRQCDLDAGSDDLPPIPSRIASNEEFVPPPQSAEQKLYEDRLAGISESASKRQGRSRRDFLRSGSGMAAALLALNQVFGDCYEVDADEVEDPRAFEERWPKDQFIFDVQTHHVDVSRKWYDATRDGDAVKAQIFGLNAARLLGVDAEAERKAIKADKLSALRGGRRYDPASQTNTQYGWVWDDAGRVPTTPVGG